MSKGDGAERQVILEWSNGFLDRDGKFVVEFQTTFNSSFWELYLNAALRSLGFALDFTHTAPDFSAARDGMNVAAEATIASNADGFAPEWEGEPGEDLSPERLRAMVEYSSLRLANALDGKLKKYRSAYSSLQHVQGKPFVICLAPFEQPFSYAIADRPLRRVLYGLDMPVYVDDEERGQRVIVGEALTEHAWKESGAAVPFGLFSDNRAREVSAVIFSSVATFGKVHALASPRCPAIFFAVRYNQAGTQPHLVQASHVSYAETLLDGLHLFLNPHAETPLDPSPFLGREIAVHHGFDEQHGHLRESVPDGFLFSRSTLGLRAVSASPSPPTPQPRTRARRRVASLAPWPDEELRPFGGGVAMYTDQHLAHYKGWTVLVVHDQIDREWVAQACRGVYRDIFSFIEGQRRDDTESLFAPACPTRDEAFSAAKLEIDIGERSRSTRV
jgi:hypothetical protein